MEFQFPEIVLSVLALFAPIVIEWIVRYVKQSWLRFLIAGGLSAVTALVTMVIMATPINLLNIPLFFTIATAAFHLFWKPMWSRKARKR
jgi:hypothetical protein